MKSVAVFILLSLLMCLTSCGEFGGNYRQVLVERDTLLAQSQRTEAQLEELKSYVDAISMSLDSIAAEESMLFLPDQETPGKALTKAQIKERLERFHELVERQHDRISSLEDSLAVSDSSLNAMRTMLAYFKVRIAEKDAEIAQMRQEIDKKNVRISDLNRKVSRLESHVEGLNTDIQNLQAANDQQKAIMDAQNKVLNEGYYLIDDKFGLASSGIKASRMSESNFDLSRFIKVDVRNFNDLHIPAKKARILTSMPENSYEMVKNADGTLLLHINDPAMFWKYTNVLIIQIR